MTTLSLRRLRRVDARWALFTALVAAWAVFVLAESTGIARVRLGKDFFQVLLWGVPTVLALTAMLRRSTTGPLPMLAGFAWLVALAVLTPRATGNDLRWGLLLPAAAIGGAVTARFPTASLSAVFALTGTYGSIRAFTGIPGDSVADKVIVGLWFGVLVKLVLGRRTLALRPTPAALLIGAYVAITVLDAITTQPFSSGIRALRLGPEFLSLVLLLAYGGFSDRTLDRLTRVMIVVSLGVGAYAALRWAIGTSAKEQALQKTTFQKTFNSINDTNESKVQGSLPNGNSLGLWLSCTMPLLMAIAVSWRGRWRLAALLALPLCTIALLGTARRTALAAVIAAGLTILVVHVLSRGYRGPRLGVALGTVMVIFISATIIYPAVIDQPAKRDRYSKLLHPSQDAAFRERLDKWGETLDAMKSEPFGVGLGAGNPQGVVHRFEDIAFVEIDNSYLLVGYEQGPVTMLLFVATLLVLLTELLRHAVWTRGPGLSAMTTAGAGTLVAILVEFMAADYYYAPVMVAGWMVVGLGVARYVRRSAPGGAVDVAV